MAICLHPVSIVLYLVVFFCEGMYRHPVSNVLHIAAPGFLETPDDCMYPPPHKSLVRVLLILGACPSPSMMRRGRFSIAPHHCHFFKKNQIMCWFVKRNEQKTNVVVRLVMH